MKIHLIAPLTVVVMFIVASSFAFGDSQQGMKTYTYKTVGDLKIQADVYAPAATSSKQQLKPVVVSIHGGALMMGHRGQIKKHLKNRLVQAGCLFISIDYRLAPETQLPEIIADIEDAFAWIGTQGPQLFGADPKRIAVMGGSAGGYLTFITGHRANPKPVALVSFFGYGDLVGDWYSTPSPHPRHQQSKMSREEAFAQVNGPPISDDRNRQTGNAGAFYQYCRQTGYWPTAVSGWDPQQDAAKFAPYMPVKNVSGDYPPTLMIHGDRDTDVPYQQSVLMAQQFKKHRVPHQLITIANGEHGFGGGERKQIDAAYDRAIEFLLEYLSIK